MLSGAFEAMKPTMPIRQQRRGFAKRLRETDDGPGQNAGHGQRQDMVKHRLHFGSTNTKRGITDGRRNRLQRRAGGR